MEVVLRWIWHRVLLVLCMVGGGVVGIVLIWTAAPPAAPVIGPVQEWGCPFHIRGTSLVVQAVTSYSGSFYEDGSGRSVTDVAALVVENTGRQDIASGQIAVEWEGQTMTFSFTFLPAGKTLLVPEWSGATFREDLPLSCYGQVEGALDSWHIGRLFLDEGGRQISLTNGTGGPLEGALLYYKHMDSATGMLIGGHTFSFRVDGIDQGAQCLLTPPNYTPGSGQVVAVMPDPYCLLEG